MAPRFATDVAAKKKPPGFVPVVSAPIRDVLKSKDSGCVCNVPTTVIAQRGVAIPPTTLVKGAGWEMYPPPPETVRQQAVKSQAPCAIRPVDFVTAPAVPATT